MDRFDAYESGRIGSYGYLVLFHNPPLQKRSVGPRLDFFSAMKTSKVKSWPDNLSADRRLTLNERRQDHELTVKTTTSDGKYLELPRTVRIFSRVEAGMPAAEVQKYVRQLNRYFLDHRDAGAGLLAAYGSTAREFRDPLFVDVGFLRESNDFLPESEISTEAVDTDDDGSDDHLRKKAAAKKSKKLSGSPATPKKKTRPDTIEPMEDIRPAGDGEPNPPPPPPRAEAARAPVRKNRQ